MTVVYYHFIFYVLSDKFVFIFSPVMPCEKLLLGCLWVRRTELLFFLKNGDFSSTLRLLLAQIQWFVRSELLHWAMGSIFTVTFAQMFQGYL